MRLDTIRETISTLVRGRPGATQDEQNARNLILSGAWLGFIDAGIMTYLGVWLARLGATPAIMGLLASAPQLINMLVVLPAGAFVERQADMVKLANRVVILHRFCYVLIALLPFVLSPEQIPLPAIAIWSLATIPGAVHFPALMAVIQRAVLPQMRPAVNGARWGLYTIVGAVLIPTFGFMIDHLPTPQGYQVAFVLSFLGSLPNIYFFGRVRVPPFQASRLPAQASQTLSRRLRAFLGPFFESKRFVRFVIATAAFRLCLSLPGGLFSLFWVDNLHATDTLIGLRGAAGYAALAFAYWFWARVTNRIGHRSLLFLAALIGVYPIMTALSPSAIWLLPAAIVWGFFVAAIDIGFVDMLLAACPEGRQPTFAAMSNMLASVQLVIGPLIGAAIAQAISVQTALIVAGVLQLASGVFFLLLPSKEEERREHVAAPAAGV